MDWWTRLAAVAGGLVLVWGVLVVGLWVAARRSGDRTADLREALRLLPDVSRLIRRLAADPTVPRGVRVRLWLLIGYLLLPIDLVPDVVPVIGYVDDAVVVALTLRAVVRHAGPEALARHWPGTAAGLATLHRLVRLPPPGEA